MRDTIPRVTLTFLSKDKVVVTKQKYCVTILTKQIMQVKLCISFRKFRVIKKGSEEIQPLIQSNFLELLVGD